MKCRGRTYSDTMHRFRERLTKGMINPAVRKIGKHKWICGGIEHQGGPSHIAVFCSRTPFTHPPLVISQEPWVRRNPEWHCDPKYRAFCWVLPQAWRDHFWTRAVNGVDSRILAKDAATWFLDAMTVQLSRHWISHERGWYEWPKQWEDYSHDQEGVREYQQGTYRKR